MRRLRVEALACAVAIVLPSPAPAQSEIDVLGVVRITQSVLADGRPLPGGTYEIRLTNERPIPLAGQSADARRVVEFVAAGTVVARETAEVLPDDGLPAVGDSSRPVRSGLRVEILKGGEFLRVSVKRARTRYLIHLPIAAP